MSAEQRSSARIVITKANQKTKESLIIFLKTLWTINPAFFIGGGLAFVICVRELLSKRKLSPLNLIFVAWIIAGSAPLLYSNYLPPRSFMWMIPACVCSLFLASTELPHRLQIVATVAILLFVLVWDWRGYRSALCPRTYHIVEFAPIAEKLLSDNLIGGSGIHNFACVSRSIRAYSDRSIGRQTPCEDGKEFYQEVKPVFISVFIGTNPERLMRDAAQGIFREPSR